jgi:hypothetical protein
MAVANPELRSQLRGPWLTWLMDELGGFKWNIIPHKELRFKGKYEKSDFKTNSPS